MSGLVGWSAWQSSPQPWPSPPSLNIFVVSTVPVLTIEADFITKWQTSKEDLVDDDTQGIDITSTTGILCLKLTILRRSWSPTCCTQDWSMRLRWFFLSFSRISGAMYKMVVCWTAPPISLPSFTDSHSMYPCFSHLRIGSGTPRGCV